MQLWRQGYLPAHPSSVHLAGPTPCATCLAARSCSTANRHAIYSDHCPGGYSTAGGGWACPAVKRPLMATGQTPIIPPSWTVPNWYIDPQNTTTCASDSNSGTSATCGGAGIGPIVTYQELNVHRWGCQGDPSACPRLSPKHDAQLPQQADERGGLVFFDPSIELGGYAAVVCPLGSAQQIATGTLNVVTLKNRAGTRHSKARIHRHDGGHCGRWLAGQHARRARIARLGRAHRHATEVASFYSLFRRSQYRSLSCSFRR